MATPVKYQLCTAEDFQLLSTWLIPVNQSPDRHCLHTWSGQTAAELQAQWLKYFRDGELCYIAAWRGSDLVGAMGSEFDRSMGRAVLQGPHAVENGWKDITSQLYKKLLAALPGEIQQFDAYLNIENWRGRNFYTQHGFSELDHLSYEFNLAKREWRPVNQQGCTALAAANHESFKLLFDDTFPGAYYSPERIIQMNGESHQVLVTSQEDRVLGFAVLSLELGPTTGELQFLGVDENYRRQGFGYRLLSAGIDWLFNKAGVQEISLNVNEDRLEARRLYESVGFKLQYSGIGMRKSF